PRRAGGVENHCRIVTPALRSLDIRWLDRDRLGEVRVARGARSRSRDRQDGRTSWRERRHPRAIVPVRAEHLRAAVPEAERNGVPAKAGEDRHVDGACLPRAEHDGDRLRHSRQETSDPITVANALGLQPSGDLCAQAGELVEALRTGHSALADPAECHAVTTDVAIDDGPSEIDGTAARPTEYPQSILPAKGAAGPPRGETAHPHRRRKT